MKPVFKIIAAFLFLATSIQSFSQEEKKKERKKYENFKERTISKTYAAAGNSLVIENSFGDVKVTTWDKNEISVNIHIEASSTDKEYADKTFNRIDVQDKQEGKEISFKTTFGNDSERGCKNCSSTMSIDYDIHLPASNTLSIKNSFGDITLPDYNGNVSLASEYGSLTTGKILHCNKLKVGFGKADIKDINNIDAKFEYSKINIGNLAGSNVLKIDFCSYSKIILDNNLSSLNLNNSYSSVHLQPAASFSASYDVSTSYGSFINKTNSDIKRTDTPGRYGPDMDKHYEGKSGSGSAKITIKSSFGTVMVGEGTESDMKEKRKVRS